MKVSSLVISILLVCFKEVQSYPLISERIQTTSVFGSYSSDKLIRFMQTFGYLQEPKVESEGLQAEFLYAETAVVEGIKNIQMFGGLETTGILDEKTIKLMSSPRCGVKDLMDESSRRKRYIIGSKNWGKRQVTYFIANFSPKVDQVKMENWVIQAFDAWAQYSRLRFKRVYDPTADIIIAFGSAYHGDRYPFDGPGNILAHAFYPYEENAFGGDIHFDNDENWKENATTLNEGVDFLTVLVHELGHSLGLAHSPVYSSIMFPYYKGVGRAQLDYDDILAMYTLYISKPLQENVDSDDVNEASNETKPGRVQDTVTESMTERVQESGEETEASRARDDIHNENDSHSVPDICEGHFDAVAYLKGNILVLKENYIWKFNTKFEIDDDYPKKLSKVFPNLPKRFKKIDAVYQIPDEDELVFFSGSEYITYDVRGPIYSAYNITRYTYDPDIKKIDAAMIWAKNNKTYLFTADRFWKYSENRQMDAFYPRIIARWNGIPGDLDAAISIPDVATIFFKGSEYWIYDDLKVKPKEGYPQPIENLLDYCIETN